MISPQQQFSVQLLSGHSVNVLKFGEVPYEQSYRAMSEFAQHRRDSDPDQIWLLEHPKVYTQGTACDLTALAPSEIPIVKTDRGGQITYHGPGQIVMYPLLRLKRYNMGVKALVNSLEQCMIDTLSELNIEALRQSAAPGVYVNGEKIGALGLRIRNGTSYHGLSLNVNVDLEPFKNIDPCGYQGLRVTNIIDHSSVDISFTDVSNMLLRNFTRLLEMP